MTKTLITTTLVLIALSITGCAGVKTRTSAQWQAELQQAFSARTGNLKACYDASGDKAKVELAIRVTATQHADSNGGASTISVESVGPSNAASKLVGCIKDVASQIVIRPEDKRNANGMWVVKFDPDVPVSANAAPVPAT